jgi:hypothetical protein
VKTICDEKGGINDDHDYEYEVDKNLVEVNGDKSKCILRQPEKLTK